MTDKMESAFTTKCVTTGTTKAMQTAMLHVFGERSKKSTSEQNREVFKNIAFLLAVNRSLASSVANELLVHLQPQLQSAAGCLTVAAPTVVAPTIVAPTVAVQAPPEAKPKTTKHREPTNLPQKQEDADDAVPRKRAKKSTT